MAAAAAAGFAGRDDDIAGYHLDVFVAEVAEHGEAGVEGAGESAVVSVRGYETADVGNCADVFEEAGVRAGHVCSHVVDEV